MSEPKPVSASDSGSSSSSPATTPTVTTITVPGTVITSTTYVTVPTTVTATATVITATRTVTATVTVAAPAPAETTAAATTSTATATAPTPEKLEVISSERAELVNEIDELISNLIQLRSSIVPRDALEARALAYIGADISMLQQIKSRALEAKTLDELNRLRQELEAVKGKYASPATGIVVNIDYKLYTIPENVVIVPQQQTPTATPPHATTTILPGVLRVGNTTIPLVEKTVTFSYEVRQAGDSFEVRGKNIDYFARVSKDSITIGNSSESQTLSKEDVAKLFAQFMVSSGVYTKERWQQLYSLVGGDRFRDVLRKWLNNERLSPEETAFLADKVKNLVNLRFLYDFNTLKQADVNLAMSMYNTAWEALPLFEKIQYKLANLFRPQTADEVYNDIINRLAEKFKRGELNTPPGEGKWRFEEVAQKIAQYSPLNWVYSQVYNALYPYLGSGASAIAGAAVGALVASLPVVGAAVAGSTGASIGAATATGLSIGAVGAGLVSLAGLASKLTDPDARKAFIEWLNQNWHILVVEIAGALAGGYLGAKAIERLPADILAKPSIWNRLPEVVRQNLIDAGVIQNVPGVRGTVAEVKVVETPAGKFQLKSSYDQSTKSITITISSEGGANIAEINIPKEITEGVFTLLEKRGVIGEADKIKFITDRVATIAKASFVGEESKEAALQRVQNFFNNVASLMRKGDATAYQLIESLIKGDIVGNVVIGADSSRIALLDKARNVLYYGTGERQLMRVVTANEKTAQIIENAIIRNDLAKIGNIVERVVSEAGVGRQIYIDTASGVGTYANVLNLRLSPVEPGEANYIAWQLQRIADLIRLDMAFRQQALTGGVSLAQLAPKYGVDPAILSRLDVAQFAQELARMASGGMDIGLIFIPSANTLNIGVVAFAPSPQALSQSIAKAVEQGLKPESAGLRAVPVHRQVIETAIVTRTVETVHSFVRTIHTDTVERVSLRESAVHRVATETVPAVKTAELVVTKTVTAPTTITQQIPFSERAIHRTDTAPYVVTRTVDVVVTQTHTQPTALTRTHTLIERPVHRTDTVPYVVTRTAEVVTTAVRFVPTAFSETASLSEKPIHRTETVPVVSTRTAAAIAPAVIPVATGIVETVPLVEKPVHRTDTVPMVITQTNTFVVATTTTIIATVSEAGTVSVVTIPLVITYTITVPITIATAAPAPPPPTPTETGVGMPTPIASPPLLPRLPGLEGAGLVPSPAKPEKKPEVEKEVLVI